MVFLLDFVTLQAWNYAVTLALSSKQTTDLSHQYPGEFKDTEPDGIPMITRNIWLPSKHFKTNIKNISTLLAISVFTFNVFHLTPKEALSTTQTTLYHEVFHSKLGNWLQLI